MYGNEIFNLTSYTDNFIQYGDWIIFSNGVSEVQNIRVSNFEEGIYKYNIHIVIFVPVYIKISY